MSPLEKEINLWMDLNPNISINDIKQSTAQSTAQYTNGNVHTIISIFYTIPKEEEETWP
jgi:hypothetical protein